MNSSHSLRTNFAGLGSAAVVVIALVTGTQNLAPAQAATSRVQRPPTVGSLTASADRAAAATDEPRYTIGPEDVLGIMVWREKDVSGDVIVRPDGNVTLPLIRDIKAAGLTPDELSERIQAALREYITDASVTVVVRQINSRKVFITGEVARPAAYPLTPSMTVMQLIAVSGGLTEWADPSAISLIRIEGGETVTLPFDYRDVTRGKTPQHNVMLKPRDTVVVPER